jgi:uncharacterized membrane protein HdeD (DUF308 family)
MEMAQTASVFDTGYETLVVPWWMVLLEGIIALIIGLFLLFYPATTTTVLITVLGFLWFFGGIFTLVGLLMNREHWGWKLLTGALGILAGLAILAYPFYSTVLLLSFFIILIGIWAMVYGAVRLAWAFNGGGWGVGLLGVLSIILGLLLLVNPLIGAVVLPWIFGVFAIAGGIIAIILGITMR